MINTTPSFLRTVLIIASMMFSSFVYSQEICNNGSDEDGDGLIDLNDPDCSCSNSIPSLIPNPSFETMNCCPSSYSQVNCATGWVQATSCTADYMNTCGFVIGAATNACLVPFPDGNGISGCIFAPGWQEYVGTCLTSPMLAGTSYSVQMNLASTPIDEQGAVCNGGTIDFGPIDIVLFGAPNCSSLPAATTDCPPAPWMPLGSFLYTPSPNWGTITITFTPSVNINTVMIGSPCTLPADYTNGPCYPYFYFDNMLLNTTASFASSTIAQSGIWCNNNIQITGTWVAGATYQWYLNGVAIVGQTNLTLEVSTLGLPVGNYSFITTVGGTCVLASCTVDSTPVISPAGPFCINAAPVNLVADVAGGIWSGIGITNANAGTFDPAVALFGNDTIIYTGAGGCPGADTAIILVNALPVSNAGNDLIICSGIVGNIGTAPSACYSYLWTPATGLSSATESNPSNTIVNNATTTIITNYTLTTTFAGCQSTDQATITVNPTPLTPTITQVGVVLNSSSITNNQWYLNTSIISGATSQNYTPTQNGSYTVVVTNAYGCSVSSNGFNFSTTGTTIEEFEDFIQIIPNPNSGNFLIECKCFTSEITVIVTNLLGEIVLSETYNSSKKQINIEGQPNGIYFVSVEDKNKKIIKKIIKQ